MASRPRVATTGSRSAAVLDGVCSTGLRWTGYGMVPASPTSLRPSAFPWSSAMRCQALLQKYFLVSFRIAVDDPEDLIPEPLIEAGRLKTVGVQEGHTALLRPRFLFQGLEESAAVAVAAEARMDPEIRDLHTLAPEGPHDPAPQVAVGVMEQDSKGATGIDRRGGDVVGDELAA